MEKIVKKKTTIIDKYSWSYIQTQVHKWHLFSNCDY